ncbi:MAG: hypothetical protein ACKVVT_05945 [Dehalococcoidia bacterium]
MRLLYLGSSIDTKGTVPDAERRAHLGGEALAAALGEPVTVTIKYIWPSERLPGKIDAWLDETSPDLAVFHWSAWWCESLVVRRKVAPKLGPLAKPVDRAWLALRRSDRITGTRAFRFANRVAMKTAGGASPFAPAEAIPLVEASLRRMVRREDLAVCVLSTPFTALAGAGPARRAWATQRRDEAYRGLRPILDQLHIPYFLPALEPDAFDTAWRDVDGLHLNAAAHRRCADLELPALREAMRRHRAE